MKRARRSGDEDGTLELTPMIDVTFLILVFFLATLRFKTLDGKLAAYLPKDAGLGSREEVEPRPSIDIRLDDSASGDPIVRVGPRAVASIDDLRLLLARLHALDPDRPVSIDPSLGVEHQAVVRVLGEVAHAGFESVRFTASDARRAER